MSTKDYLEHQRDNGQAEMLEPYYTQFFDLSFELRKLTNRDRGATPAYSKNGIKARLAWRHDAWASFSSLQIKTQESFDTYAKALFHGDRILFFGLDNMRPSEEDKKEVVELGQYIVQKATQEISFAKKDSELEEDSDGSWVLDENGERFVHCPPVGID